LPPAKHAHPERSQEEKANGTEQKGQNKQEQNAKKGVEGSNPHTKLMRHGLGAGPLKKRSVAHAIQGKEKESGVVTQVFPGTQDSRTGPRIAVRIGAGAGTCRHSPAPRGIFLPSPGNETAQCMTPRGREQAAKKVEIMRPKRGGASSSERKKRSSSGLEEKELEGNKWSPSVRKKGSETRKHGSGPTKTSRKGSVQTRLAKTT